jgi:hypothetical protein
MSFSHTMIGEEWYNDNVRQQERAVFGEHTLLNQIDRFFSRPPGKLHGTASKTPLYLQNR